MIEQLTCFSLIMRQVIHAHRDDSCGTGDEVCGPAAFRAMPPHVFHLAVHAVGEPFAEARFGLAELDVADAELLKTERLPPAQDIRLQLRQVARCFCHCL